MKKVLVRPPRVQGHFQFFGFMVSNDDFLKLSHIAFKHIWPSRTPNANDYLLFNADTYVQASLRIPKCFTASVKILPGMELPPEYLAAPNRIHILALWADSLPDEGCPWPGHIFRLRKIGRAPQWWVGSSPEHSWRSMFRHVGVYLTKRTVRMIDPDVFADPDYRV